MDYYLQNIEELRRHLREKSVVIYGAGEYAMRFLNHYNEIINSVSFIVVSDTKDKPDYLYGIPIKHISELNKTNPNNTVVVIAMGNHISLAYERIRSINEFVIFSARILLNPVFCSIQNELYHGEEEIKKVEDMLYDTRSKAVYREVITRRVFYGEDDFRDLITSGDTEYLIPMLFENKCPDNEVILDCGAASGDSLKQFVDFFGERLKKIYCFECFESAIEELNKEVAFIRQRDYFPEINVMPYALSNQSGTKIFAQNHNPFAGFIVDNRRIATKNFTDFKLCYSEVDVETIDNVINSDETVTLIKMDIEGSEYEALLGATRIITKCKPRLAISIYHNGMDYFRIPLLVKQLVPEYKIAIRHHSKNHCDTDMYCWI